MPNQEDKINLISEKMPFTKMAIDLIIAYILLTEIINPYICEPISKIFNEKNITTKKITLPQSTSEISLPKRYFITASKSK